MNRKPGETLDHIVFPDLSVVQKKKGYRFSLDPLLLVSFLVDPPPGPLMDLGCGSGVMALLAARLWPRLKVSGLEIQEGLAAMARRSAAMNGLDRRVAIIRGDLRNCSRTFRPGSFGSVICNPPYRKLGTGRLPPDREKAVARHEISMTLEDLLEAMDHLLVPGGCFSISWKPERMDDLARNIRGRGLVLRTVRPVHSRRGLGPFLILCSGVKGSPGPDEPEFMEPLTIYQGNRYTPEVYNILIREVPLLARLKM
jgi:tRNA1Val (adenine37-N6)-methyltransferase